MTADPDTSPEIALRVIDPRDPVARACLSEYYAELDRRFPTGFDVSLSADPDAEAMIAPRGTFLVAEDNEGAAGCAGLKGTDLGWAEVKRLWIAPRMRGQGLARRMMERLEDSARALGATRLRLDTNTALPEAVAMYRALGWTEIPRFNDDPYAQVFFERRL